jgi:hypothetical protein
MTDGGLLAVAADIVIVNIRGDTARLMRGRLLTLTTNGDRNIINRVRSQRSIIDNNHLHLMYLDLARMNEGIENITCQRNQIAPHLGVM